MSDPLTIATIGAGIGAAGDLAQGAINWFSQDENRKRQEHLARHAIEIQMKDLKKAGINPLMAGRMGGIDTPTLQAPQMTGIDRAVDQITPTAISRKALELQQQQMTIEQTNAETEKTRAERDRSIAEAALTNTTNTWYEPRVKQEMNLASAQETETKARTATIDAMREPQIQNIMAEAAKKAQETLTEQQRTKEMREIANNAAQLYKAKAKEAFTIAEQAADYYAKYWNETQSQTIDKGMLTIQLMKSENFAKVIENILANDYGRVKAISQLDWGKLLGPAILGDAKLGNKFKVTQ